MLTQDQILLAAEEVLRKFGPRKTTVVDVARSLGVSHGSVYRHFKSKADLHEAIIAKWLESVIEPLAIISKSKQNPKKRLRCWFETLNAIKQSKAENDSEMFESYTILVQASDKAIVSKHLGILIEQIESILEAGKALGVFNIEDCQSVAKALFSATYKFHHPLHVDEWQQTGIDTEFDEMYQLLERAICTA